MQSHSGMQSYAVLKWYVVVTVARAIFRGPEAKTGPRTGAALFGIAPAPAGPGVAWGVTCGRRRGVA